MTLPPPPTTPRFYVEEPLAPGARLDLPERVVRHIAVLRLHAGDALTLFNGSGGEYDCVIRSSARNAVTAHVRGWRDVERESGIHITLAIGVSGADRMDYVVQKAIELGTAALQPLATERSVIRLTAERAVRRLAHWRGIAVAACEQCGRNRIPEIHPVAALDAFLCASDSGAPRLLMAPEATIRLSEIARADRVTVLVGPEGGLSAEEQERTVRAGFIAARIGPRVLRTETAPVAVISALQALWGDI